MTIIDYKFNTEISFKNSLKFLYLYLFLVDYKFNL